MQNQSTFLKLVQSLKLLMVLNLLENGVVLKNKIGKGTFYL